MTAEAHKIEYNSQRDKLIIPEYGRHVQSLINYAKTIEDKAYRQKFVEELVDLIQQMSPSTRNLDEYRAKIWKHIFLIADYELDVDPPEGISISKEIDQKPPDPVEYPQSRARYRHYGNNVQIMIDKALEMEEGDLRDGFVQVIASYMKLAYQTWNKEHYVSDEVIKTDLETLSNGELTVEDDMSINKLANRRGRRRSSKRSSGRGRSNRSRRRK